jgi:hypothetical protein
MSLIHTELNGASPFEYLTAWQRYSLDIASLPAA